MHTPFRLNSVYVASGHELDLWADACEQDVCRGPGEPDAAFRERVIAAMFPLPSGPTITLSANIDEENMKIFESWCGERDRASSELRAGEMIEELKLLRGRVSAILPDEGPSPEQRQAIADLVKGWAEESERRVGPVLHVPLTPSIEALRAETAALARRRRVYPWIGVLLGAAALLVTIAVAHWVLP